MGLGGHPHTSADTELPFLFFQVNAANLMLRLKWNIVTEVDVNVASSSKCSKESQYTYISVRLT